jgi:plasminogen activator inhibitor 1 RNA-binding protein
MENQYGIGVANRYALFLNDAEDPLEVLKVQEQEKEAKKKTKLSEKENKGKTETKGKTAQVARKGIKETQNVKTLESGKSKEGSVLFYCSNAI